MDEHYCLGKEGKLGPRYILARWVESHASYVAHVFEHDLQYSASNLVTILGKYHDMAPLDPINTIEGLLSAVKPYASLPPGMAEKLEGDRLRTTFARQLPEPLTKAIEAGAQVESRLNVYHKDGLTQAFTFSNLPGTYIANDKGLQFTKDKRDKAVLALLLGYNINTRPVTDAFIKSNALVNNQNRTQAGKNAKEANSPEPHRHKFNTGHGDRPRSYRELTELGARLFLAETEAILAEKIAGDFDAMRKLPRNMKYPIPSVPPDFEQLSDADLNRGQAKLHEKMKDAAEILDQMYRTYEAEAAHHDHQGLAMPKPQFTLEQLDQAGRNIEAIGDRQLMFRLGNEEKRFNSYNDTEKIDLLTRSVARGVRAQMACHKSFKILSDFYAFYGAVNHNLPEEDKKVLDQHRQRLDNVYRQREDFLLGTLQIAQDHTVERYESDLPLGPEEREYVRESMKVSREPGRDR
jgi:hypothetical protein